MKLFAVRTIEGQQPVGFFWVRNLLGLLVAVDNFHDPDACEYKPIRREAAIVWPWLGQWQMGVDVELGDPDAEAAHVERVMVGIDFDGAFDEFISGLAVKRWKPLINPKERS